MLGHVLAEPCLISFVSVYEHKSALIVICDQLKAKPGCAFPEPFITFFDHVQSTLVISNSLISINRLSRSENLVPVLTENYQQATKYCGKEEKLLLRSNFSSFSQYFQYFSNLRVKLHIHSVKGGCSINCFTQFHKSGMSKYGYLEVFHRVP